MIKSKKGDLSLSINAIVVLILAITMLGLGLAFMRNIFGSATKEFQEVGGTVQKQMIDQMKESTKAVDISNPKITIKPGEKKQVFIGFKNELTDAKDMQIREVEASLLGDPTAANTNKYTVAADTGDITATGSGTICGSITKSGTTISHPSNIYIEFKSSKTSVPGASVLVLPINIITSSNAIKGTCTYEIKVDTNPLDTADPNYNEVIELTVDVTP